MSEDRETEVEDGVYEEEVVTENDNDEVHAEADDVEQQDNTAETEVELVTRAKDEFFQTGKISDKLQQQLIKRGATQEEINTAVDTWRKQSVSSDNIEFDNDFNREQLEKALAWAEGTKTALEKRAIHQELNGNKEAATRSAKQLYADYILNTMGYKYKHTGKAALPIEAGAPSVRRSNRLKPIEGWNNPESTIEYLQNLAPQVGVRLDHTDLKDELEQSRHKIRRDAKYRNEVLKSLADTAIMQAKNPQIWREQAMDNRQAQDYTRALVTAMTGNPNAQTNVL